MVQLSGTPTEAVERSEEFTYKGVPVMFILGFIGLGLMCFAAIFALVWAFFSTGGAI